MALYTKQRLEEIFAESRMRHQAKPKPKPKPKQPKKTQTETPPQPQQPSNKRLWEPRDTRWIDEEWPTYDQLWYLKEKIKLINLPNLKLKTKGMRPKGKWERALKDKTLDEDECDIIRMWADSVLHQLIIKRRRQDKPQAGDDER